MTILGISVGTSRTGVCIIKDDVLLDRQVHDFPHQWSDAKSRIILNRYRQYLQRHPVDAIVLEIPPTASQSDPVRLLIRKLKKLAEKHYCEFDYVTKFELKSNLHLRSTEEIIRYAVQAYPELSALYEKGIATKHAFYKKVFEAVLAAHYYNERQKSKAQQIANTN